MLFLLEGADTCGRWKLAAWDDGGVELGGLKTYFASGADILMGELGSWWVTLYNLLWADWS